MFARTHAVTHGPTHGLKIEKEILTDAWQENPSADEFLSPCLGILYSLGRKKYSLPREKRGANGRT